MSQNDQEVEVPFDEDDWNDENHELLYIKYLFEGVESLSDLATALRAFANELDERVGAGWHMEEPVCGGHAHLRRVLGTGDVATK